MTIYEVYNIVDMYMYEACYGVVFALYLTCGEAIHVKLITGTVLSSRVCVGDVWGRITGSRSMHE